MTAGLVWSVVLAALGVLGLWLAGSGRRVGWAIGLGAQLLWATYAIVTAQWGFIASALAYGIVYGRNLARARRPERAPSPARSTLEQRAATDDAWHRGYDAGVTAHADIAARLRGSQRRR